MGASPRGSLALFKASQAQAALRERDYVIPDDVKKMVEVTLSHRVIGRFERTDGGGKKVFDEILSRVAVPV